MRGGMVGWLGQYMEVHMFCRPTGCCGPEQSMVEVDNGIWGLH